MGYAQNIQDFSGKVVSDSLDISGIHVVNKNSGATTITNRKGEFSIGVRPTDTILFSAVHIKLQALVLDSLVLSQPKINVYIEHAVNELEEVVVKPWLVTSLMMLPLLRLPQSILKKLGFRVLKESVAKK